MFAPKLINKFLYVLIASLVIVGCDSNDDDEGGEDTPAAELFLGNWEVTSAADMGGTRDQSALFAGDGTLTINFDDAAMYGLNFDFVDEMATDLDLQGAYSLSESGMTVTLSISAGAFDLPLELSYRFVNEDTVELTTSESAALNLLLGSSLEGDVVLVLERIG